MPTHAVLLDLDGVLLDSRDALVNLYQDMIREFGLPLRSRDDILECSGKTEEQWIRTMAPEMDEAVLKTAIQWCESHYAQSYLPVFAKPMPGAKELLYHLQARRVKKAIVTNQSKAQSVASLKLIGYGGIDAVVTYEDVEKPKPDAAPLRRALELLGVPAQNALYVGDTQIDLDAGIAAGVRTILLKAPWNAHVQADKVAELDDILVKMYNA
ncbi:HAD-IA family hydrolase [Candidatus Micrarchaeota archaeon]|nr:HAD-IA family hydrolase [Candidatus Micrarchaeota archaeon]